MLLVIRWLAGLVALWTYALIFYYMFLSIFGYKKAKRNYKIHKPKLKFLILIPSHNEENVIGVTIENLQQIDYPKDLYQIVVVSDQSTDATTAIANAEGMKVIDTSLGAHPRIGVGKSGQYEVHLTTADGQDKTITLTVLDNKKSISGEDFTMTVGDKQSTAGDFKAVATDEDGKSLEVTPDYSKVDFNTPGDYKLILKAADGQEKEVTLYIKAKATNPGNPGNPSNPSNPGNLSNPGTPGNPSQPGNPSNPTNPSEPIDPNIPNGSGDVNDTGDGLVVPKNTVVCSLRSIYLYKDANFRTR